MYISGARWEKGGSPMRRTVEPAQNQPLEGIMTIERIEISRLKHTDYNPRKDLKPGDKEYEKLKRSIATFGFVEPIVLNKQTGNIVGGHQRAKVLEQ